MSVKKRLGLKIKNLRNKNGLTQKKFAEKINKNESTVRMWELGKNEPDGETLLLISRFFDVTIDHLLGKTDNYRPPEVSSATIKTSKHAFTMRIQSENFKKIKEIAEFNKRSIAMQIEFLIQECITDFENKHGKEVYRYV